MLRSLGFLTGMALTALLTLALTDDVAVDGLRRSAQTLFTGTEPAQPPTLAASAAAAERPSGDPIGVAGASRPDRDPTTPAIPPPGSRNGAGLSARLAAPVSSRTQDPESPAGSGASPGATAPGAPAGRPKSRLQPPVDGRMATSSDSTRSTFVAPQDGVSGGRAATDVSAVPGRPAPAGSNSVDTTARTADAAEVSQGRTVPPARSAHLAPAMGPPGRAEVVASPPTREAGGDAVGVGPAPGGLPAGTADDRPGPPESDLPPAVGATDGAGEWHVFWTPFRSEASADGFAQHLRRATGTDYEVIRTAPGEYRVAFWHESEVQRGERISAIERASGLRLRSGEL